MSRLLLVAVLLLAAALASAFEADTPLADPALEARAHVIARSLRCLVCQNESIEDSNADLARDLRRIVRERLAAGDTDNQARQYVVDRYGDWVLLKPPFKPATWALWLGPPILLVAGGVGIWRAARRKRLRAGDAEPPLSSEEARRIAALLDPE
ncbi:MAG TPA: cytochrome c-type biogenesis protein [Candidatus Cybelea sp.]|nr:cytochrome c-type biogenesis protein [Candidatus Cybelea sp.]